jgi:hypothetical protein
MIVDKFQWVFSEALLNACGKDLKFGHCQRVLTLLRLGLPLTATCASQRVETIANCTAASIFSVPPLSPTRPAITRWPSPSVPILPGDSLNAHGKREWFHPAGPVGTTERLSTSLVGCGATFSWRHRLSLSVLLSCPQSLGRACCQVVAR